MADAGSGSIGGPTSFFDAQPASATQSARAGAMPGSQESDLVLIDVGLLLDARFPVALLVLRVELFVPPQGAPFFLLLDDLRLVPEQLADHSGDIGFVGLRHGYRAGLYAACQTD